MAQTVDDLFALAVSACHGDSTPEGLISSSRAYTLCERWYDIVRKTILRAAYWPSVTSTGYLAVLAEASATREWAEGDPTPPWRYVYGLPSNYIRARYLTTYAKFEMTSFSGAPALQCDEQKAILVYTRDEENITLWEEDLKMAVIYGLASHIGAELTGSRYIIERNIANTDQLIGVARANFMNENSMTLETVPPWISERGFINAPKPRFYYPEGAMLAQSMPASIFREPT